MTGKLPPTWNQYLEQVGVKLPDPPDWLEPADEPKETDDQQ